jgi:hypothetical protein
MSDELTEKIIGAAIEVHRALGPGLLESVYEEALYVELQLRGISFQRQLAHLPDVAVAQTLSYLKATGLKRALLLNFGERKLVNGIKRISL